MAPWPRPPPSNPTQGRTERQIFPLSLVQYGPARCGTAFARPGADERIDNEKRIIMKTSITHTPFVVASVLS